jgi:hypothetical protein
VKCLQTFWYDSLDGGSVHHKVSLSTQNSTTQRIAQPYHDRQSKPQHNTERIAQPYHDRQSKPQLSVRVIEDDNTKLVCKISSSSSSSGQDVLFGQKHGFYAFFVWNLWNKRIMRGKVYVSFCLFACSIYKRRFIWHSTRALDAVKCIQRLTTYCRFTTCTAASAKDRNHSYI